MNLPAKLVLLPGMDGTGELFKDFSGALPDSLDFVTLRYPTAECLSYVELMPRVLSAVPTAEPYVLLAESYSTPLAIQFAARNPAGLKGLILCAGFASSPIKGWQRAFYSFFASALFRVKAPKAMIKYFLIDPNAPPLLTAGVQAAISMVEARVMMTRLRDVLRCDVEQELSKVGVPILYLQAKHDRLIPGRCGAEIQRIQPQTLVEVIDGPHLILQREPMRAALQVSKFIQEL